ncbi:MAG: VOC family protein [Pseudomonadota bacterium]
MDAGKANGPSWFDITVEHADQLRDFYAAVCGWSAEPHDMGSYQDYSMKAENGEVVAGICHARGDNAALPPVWIMYIPVEDIDAALTQVKTQGGAVLELRDMGPNGKIAIIRDPAGAHVALWQQGSNGP